MPALHIRNVPESVLTALRERADHHGQSVQEEVRQLLATAAAAPLSGHAPNPVGLTTVRTATDSTWSRDEIYGDRAR